MKKLIGFLILVMLVSGCAKTALVFVPARFDLMGYREIGIINFKSNVDSSVDIYATQQFQEYTQAAQLNTSFIELGSMEKILSEFGFNQLDARTIRKIGEKYNFSAIFYGDIEYSDVQAKVDLKDLVKLRGSVKTYLYATLSVQLKKTDNGANIWSKSSSFKRSLAKFKYGKDGNISVGMGGYHDAHKKLIPDMINDITRDFRGKYVKQLVNPKTIYK